MCPNCDGPGGQIVSGGLGPGAASTVFQNCQAHSKLYIEEQPREVDFEKEAALDNIYSTLAPKH